MKNILITGAAGDIGKKIIEKYHKKFIIICVDKNLKKLNLIKKNINHYKFTNQICQIINL